jgi:hypothetical protein
MRALIPTLLVAWSLAACGLAVAEPKVTMTSHVEREKIELTIYNPAVSLVQELRIISLNKGLNEFRVSWAGVNVDRSSVRLEVRDGEKDVVIRDAVLLQDNPNTVIWRLEANRPGQWPVSISYYASGFSWSADYVLTVDEEEKTLRLNAWADVANRSGEDYQDAAVRLVMGDVRLVSVAPSASAGRSVIGAQRAAEKVIADLEEEPSLPFGREGFAEYTFYTLERPETLDTGEVKRIALAASTVIPVRKVYIFDPSLFGQNVAMQYWFENKKDYDLGPMPPGLLRAYRQEKPGRLSLLGEDSLPYVPLGDTAKIYLGNARNILVETAQTDYQRTDEQWSPDKSHIVSYVEEAEFKVTVKNLKANAVEMIVRQYIRTDAKLMRAEPTPEQPKLGTLEWKLRIPAGKTQEITYRTSRRVYT